jgi:hypothetical protein
VNFDHLCPELRLQALCLPPPHPAPVNRGGRPGLRFNDRRDVLLLCNEIAGALARRGESSRNPELRPLLRHIRRALQRGEGLLARRLSAQADAIGRYSQTSILKPAEAMPVIDRAVAEEFARRTGKSISERTVRWIRADKRLAALVGKPVFEPPDWLVEQTKQIWLRQRASQYLTPAVMAKIARGEILLREFDGHIHLTPTTDGMIAGPAPRPRVGTHCGCAREESQPKGGLPGSTSAPARRMIRASWSPLEVVSPLVVFPGEFPAAFFRLLPSATGATLPASWRSGPCASTGLACGRNRATTGRIRTIGMRAATLLRDAAPLGRAGTRSASITGSARLPSPRGFASCAPSPRGFASCARWRSRRSRPRPRRRCERR